MKSIKFVVAVLVVVSAVPAFGQSASADLDVTAQVVANCAITTTPVDFLTYDPLSATPDDDGQGTITVRCTRGLPGGVTIEIEDASRQMVGVVNAETLSYDLYTDAARGTVWGTGAAAVNPGLVTPAGTTLQVYGRIPAGQDVIVDTYNQTLTATINY